VVGARLAQGFAGRFLVAKACILVFLEVFVVRFFPNVFIALDSGFLPADTLFEGGCGGVVGRWRFVVTQREVDSGSTCSSTRRTGALPRVDLSVTIEGPSLESSSASSSKCTCRLEP
jgi:hypothetical protein